MYIIRSENCKTFFYKFITAGAVLCKKDNNKKMLIENYPLWSILMMLFFTNLVPLMV